MDKQQVVFLETKPVSIFFDSQNKFEFRADKKFHWIQKILFWCLKNIGAYSKSEDIKLERYEFNTDDLINEILRQDENILNFYHHRGEKLLIGSENFSRLMNSREFNQMVTINAPYLYGSDYCFYNLKITVIPWMKGMLVVPKEI
jgi:hypothetical protein